MGSAQAVLITTLDAGALALRPFTIVRTRGSWYVRSDQVSAVENYAAFYGQSVVSEQASAIGVTAVPTPSTDSDSDLFNAYSTLGGSAVAGQTSEGGHIEVIDSKAMRKVEEGMDVVEVIENPFATGVVVGVYTRLLVKLH